MAATPTRTCVACRRSQPKRSLMRLVAARGTVTVDPRARLAGRGVYVCPRTACIDHASRRDAAVVVRALRLRPTDVTVESETLRTALHDAAARQVAYEEELTGPVTRRR